LVSDSYWLDVSPVIFIVGALSLSYFFYQMLASAGFDSLSGLADASDKFRRVLNLGHFEEGTRLAGIDHFERSEVGGGVDGGVTSVDDEWDMEVPVTLVIACV
jgi:hypothetical protein